jgi:hypothetical protein
LNTATRFRHWLAANLPRSPWLRVPLGIALVLGGALGFLPVLGFWMIPVGLAVLAIDFPPARRLGRRLIVWVGRRFKPKRGNGNGRTP